MHKLGQVSKKIFLLFLACLMVYIILPPVLFHNVKAPEDYGEFLRFSPHSEEYSRRCGEFADTSKGQKASLEFDISHFKDTDVGDFVSAKIRLAFLKGSGSINNHLSLRLGNIDDFAVITPYTKGDEDVLWEIDVTEYVKNLVKNNIYNLRTEISSDNNIGVLMATGENADPLLRPCLKIATGEWVDIDSHTLNRAEVLNTVYVSEKSPQTSASELTDDMVYTGDGNVTYIAVRLNQSAFYGEASSAILSLDKRSLGNTEIEIHCLNNNEWTPENLYADNLPGGPEMTVKNTTIKGIGRVNIDVTQAINEARQKGIDALTFYIKAKSEAAFLRNAQIYINETDNQNLICAIQAGVYALSNNNPQKVTTALRRVYTAENGETANISWKDNSTVPRIKENGEIIRPLWYENDADVIAEAEISSGNQKITREFNLKILREEKTRYKDYEFKNFINIGKAASEKDAKFESIRTSGTKRRWTGGGYSDYRTLSENGVMLLNLACNGDKDNYITFKLWSEDLSCVMYLADCETDEVMEIKTPDAVDKGFIYATYKLPESFTKNKEYVSIRLSAIEESCGIYDVYITDNACFKPAEFKAHGEKLVENAFSHLAVRETEIDGDNKIITFFARDSKAVFEISENTATVSQTLKGYSRYTRNCPIISEDGVCGVDYGTYKLIWNETETEKPIPYEKLSMSGVYRDVETGIYYTFFEDWQTDGEVVIPQNARVYDGKTIHIKEGEIMMLSHVANPVQNSAWKVLSVNGNSIAEMGFDKDEKLESVELMLMGSLSETAETAQIIVGVYENEKLLSLDKKTFKISGEIYNIDFSDTETYIKENQTLRIFVIYKTRSLTEIQPIIEIS